jgi:phenylalanyl-tRNA synthetase beta chain
MQVSLSWLSAHIDLSHLSIPQLSDLLTFAGIEVEGIEQKGVNTDLIVVGQVAESIQHPDAEKLSVCQVDVGQGTLRQIVCGAKNFKVGDKVPVALPGAELPGGFQIKEGKLRGIASLGMMCSGRELGLSDDHAGLLILDPNAANVGTPFRELVEPDVLLDLEITPNRPDLLSHLGLARELAALTGLPLKGEAHHAVTDLKTRAATVDEIRLDAPEACPLYIARIIRGVKVAASPEWLQKRLHSIGLRPINNLVDITNYILMEMGQPLHAFDLAKLNGGIVVRHAAEGETLVALDGQTCALQPDDLVIADKDKPLAIAGVMGGLDSGVTETTTDVLLEVAYFQPSGIRRTSRRLSLHTDSAYRFERGADPHQALGAADAATRLILAIAGGKTEDHAVVAGAAPALVSEVELDETRARQLLGIPSFTADEGHGILEKLGLLKVTASTSDAPVGALAKVRPSETSRWQIPSYRLDLQRPVDLIEELARVLGLDRVPSRFRAAFAATDTADRAYDHLMALRHAMANRGFHEAQTLRLISQAQLSDALGASAPKGLDSAAVPVKNPLSEDHTHLRPSIVPGLIATAALNLRQGAAQLRFFEAGRVFLALPKNNTREEERLAILLSGPVAPSSWHAREPQAADFYDLLGLIQNLVGPGVAIEPKAIDDTPGFLLTSELRQGNRNLGWIAQLHPARARAIDARHPVYVAELLPSALRQLQSGPAKFEDLPRFPAISRDIALECPQDLSHAQILAALQKAKPALLTNIDLFDQFRDPSGQKLASDRKSLAYTLTYRAPDRTLETAEVDTAHQSLLTALEKALPVTLRK